MEKMHATDDLAAITDGGKTFQLQATRDHQRLTSLIQHPDLTIFQSPTAQASIKWLQQRYIDAGSPPLTVIDEAQERIHQMIEMDLFLGNAYEPRYDTPGSGFPGSRRRRYDTPGGCLNGDEL